MVPVCVFTGFEGSLKKKKCGKFHPRKLFSSEIVPSYVSVISIMALHL